MANCQIERVNPEPALAMKGVVAYISHKDIHGANNSALGRYKEQIFTTLKVTN